MEYSGIDSDNIMIGGSIGDNIIGGSSGINSRTPSIRVIVKKHSGGIKVDADIIIDILQKCKYDVDLVVCQDDKYKNNRNSDKHNRNINGNTGMSDKHKKYDYQFFIEHYIDGYHAANSFLVVNHEFLYDWDVKALHEGKVKAIAKTHIGSQILKELGIDGIYTSFTTPVPDSKGYKKDTSLVVHLAGSSPFKGTKTIMQTWNENKGFIDANKDVKLLILRSEGPITHLSDDAKYWESLSVEKNKTLTIGNTKLYDLEAVGNMYLCKKYISVKDLNNIILKAAIHICISSAEGWGHIINQSLGVGAITITTDAAPMNEVVNKNNGILVPTYSNNTIQKFLSKLKHTYIQNLVDIPLVDVKTEDLAIAIRKALTLDTTQFDEISSNAIETYKNNTKFAEVAFCKLIKGNKD